MRTVEQLKSKIAATLALVMATTMLLPALPAQAIPVRLKDLVHIKGVRDNQLVGYGVVVGLQTTGDKSRSTQQTQKNLLLNFGAVVANANDIKNNNSAAVIVTATIPAFAKPGDKIDVTVSSMADAKSLEGGVLVQTQLIGPNGEVVALAQGPISTGGSSADAAGSSKRTSITTSGRIPNGAIVEREMMTTLGDDYGLDLVLNHSDFTLAQNVAETISKKLCPALATDGGTVRVEVPGDFGSSRVPLIAALENIIVETSPSISKVIINERTGTVVIGNAVRLHPAAVAQGGITVSIQAVNQVSQPGGFAKVGTTTGVTNAKIDIEKREGSVIELDSNATLQDLVTALNTLGVTPSDLISILQALKSAGSLEANIEII